MKKFRIDESEKERILGMHIEATKRQYLSEQEDYEIDWTPEQKKAHMEGAMKLYSTVKPEMGSKYCFAKSSDKNSVIKALVQNIQNSGLPGKVLYKIKAGDTLDGIKKLSQNYDIVEANSKSCDMRNPRANDIIIYSL